VVCGQELPICVPTLKVIASSVKLGHVPQATPNFVPICGPGQELPTAYVHAEFEDRSFTRLRNIEGVPKFRNWVTYPRPRPLRGKFVVRGQ